MSIIRGTNMKKKQKFDLNDLPTFNDLNKKVDKNTSDFVDNSPQLKTKYVIKSKAKYFYVIPLINILLFIIVSILLIVFKVTFIWLFIYFIFSIPFFIANIGVLMARLFFDKKKIKKELIVRLSKNFLIARFITTTGKIIEEIVKPIKSDDYLTFTYEDGLYIVEPKCIRYNERNHPVSHYILGVPNPIDFKILMDELENFLDKIRKLKPNEILTNLENDSGKLMDLSFTSTNLQQFKKAKLFQDFFTTGEEMNKMMAIFVIMVIVFVIAIVIIIALK